MLIEVEIAYSKCFFRNTKCKYKRYKYISQFLSLYLKQPKHVIKDTRNFYLFENIFCENRIYCSTLPNKLYLQLRRVQFRCWPQWKNTASFKSVNNKRNYYIKYKLKN